MDRVRKIKVPIDNEVLAQLRAGDELSIKGIMYVARDAAHKRIFEALSHGLPAPFDIQGTTVYYMGPSPARAGKIIGSAGPTTSGRMDIYTPLLIAKGLRTMIGKGPRAKEVKDAMMQYGAVYLGAIGGAGALISQSIRSSRIIAYEDLGAEAVHQIEVVDFPCIVINDTYGGDLYESGKAQYHLES